MTDIKDEYRMLFGIKGISDQLDNYINSQGEAYISLAIPSSDINNNLTYTELDTVYFMYGGAMRFLKCEVDIVDTDFSWNTGSSAIGGALSIDSCSICIDSII